MSKYAEVKKITVNHIKNMKKLNEKITCLTAYDYTSAQILDAAGIEIALVGDSLGMVINGYENTINVTLDEMIYHAKAVKRGTSRSFITVDIPFGFYHTSTRSGVENCIRVIKETGAEAVKIEGGSNRTKLVKQLTENGINVMGHIGLMPQYVHTMGGYKIQGKEGAEKLLEDALSLQEAGVFSIVLEGIIADTAAEISNKLSIPTIGIGSGAGCDGQVLVFHDVFGFFDDFSPKFVKKYCNAKELLLNAAKEYICEVKGCKFPDKEHSYTR